MSNQISGGPNSPITTTPIRLLPRHPEQPSKPVSTPIRKQTAKARGAMGTKASQLSSPLPVMMGGSEHYIGDGIEALCADTGLQTRFKSNTPAGAARFTEF